MSKKFRAQKLILGLCLAAAVAGCSSPPPTPPKTPAATPSKVASATPSAAPTATASATPSATPSASPSASPAGSASPAAAAGKGTTLTQDDCGVSFTVPAGWQQTNKNGVIMVGPEDGTLAVMFIVPEEDEIEQACKDLDKLLGKIMTDIKVDGEGKPTEVNGMKSFTIDGTGKSDGKEVLWSVDLVKANKLLMVLSFGEKDNIKKHTAELGVLASSLKKIEEKGGKSEE